MDSKQPAGILPAQTIRELAEAGVVRAQQPLDPGQIQPASLDLRLGATVWRVRASFLPGRRPVRERLEQLALHRFSLEQGAVLETGCVYIAEIQEGLALPPELSASANPKSSTGRLDVFTRLITDQGEAFDVIPAGYNGPLYAEISPRTFPVLVRKGSRLSQIRFRTGNSRLSDAELAALHAREPVVDAAVASFQGGVAVSVDLSGLGPEGLLGYRAKRFTSVVDVDRVGVCAVRDYWEPLHADGSGALILDPGQFYILASREAVTVPPDFAAEMVPFDPLVGEFRVHYAEMS